jgi:hypothetical protein
MTAIKLDANGSVDMPSICAINQTVPQFISNIRSWFRNACGEVDDVAVISLLAFAQAVVDLTVKYHGTASAAIQIVSNRTPETSHELGQLLMGNATALFEATVDHNQDITQRPQLADRGTRTAILWRKAISKHGNHQGTLTSCSADNI